MAKKQVLNIVFLRFLLPIAAGIFFRTAPVYADSTESILNRAVSLLGTPYLSGGADIQGFDCSGFVRYLYESTVPDIPQISRDMVSRGTPVLREEWKPGDLLFYATGHDQSTINHVSIWYGEETLIHSISDGPETGVVMTPAKTIYWTQRYITARRILPDENYEEIPPPEEAEDKDVVIPSIEDSPWNDYDGYLRGDFDAWKQSEEEAFEAYKAKNG